MVRKKSVLDRWDKNVRDESRIIFEGASQPEISRHLWSFYKFFHKSGEVIFGKKQWNNNTKELYRKDGQQKRKRY